MFKQNILRIAIITLHISTKLSLGGDFNSPASVLDTDYASVVSSASVLEFDIEKMSQLPSSTPVNDQTSLTVVFSLSSFWDNQDEVGVEKKLATSLNDKSIHPIVQQVTSISRTNDDMQDLQKGDLPSDIPYILAGNATSIFPELVSFRPTCCVASYSNPETTVSTGSAPAALQGPVQSDKQVLNQLNQRCKVALQKENAVLAIMNLTNSSDKIAVINALDPSRLDTVYPIKWNSCGEPISCLSIVHYCIDTCDQAALMAALRKGAQCTGVRKELKNKDSDGYTVLHELCCKDIDHFPNMVEIITIMLERNPNLIDIEDASGRKPLKFILRNKNFTPDKCRDFLKKLSRFLKPSYHSRLLKFVDSVSYPFQFHPRTDQSSASAAALERPVQEDKQEQNLVLEFLKLKGFDRIAFIEALDAPQLDAAIEFNVGHGRVATASLLHVCIDQKDEQALMAALEKNVECSCIADNQQTILHALCTKSLGNFPHMKTLISKILIRNINLLDMQTDDGKTAAQLILENPYLNDKITFEILKVLKDAGSDYHYQEFFEYFRDVKPLTLVYLQEYCSEPLQAAKSGPVLATAS